MRTFILSIVTITVLGLFGTCFILAGETLLNIYGAKTVNSNYTVPTCTVKNQVVTCKY